VISASVGLISASDGVISASDGVGSACDGVGYSPDGVGCAARSVRCAPDEVRCEREGVRLSVFPPVPRRVRGRRTEFGQAAQRCDEAGFLPAAPSLSILVIPEPMVRVEWPGSHVVSQTRSCAARYRATRAAQNGPDSSLSATLLTRSTAITFPVW
jgi:hypothetical protein